MPACVSRTLYPHILPVGLLIGNQLLAFDRPKSSQFYHLMPMLSALADKGKMTEKRRIPCGEVQPVSVLG